MSPRKLLIPLAIVALAGCTPTPPDYNEALLSVETPDGWQSTGARIGVPDSDWIDTFNDRRLKKLVEEVEENNYDIRIAAARMEQAKAEAIIAGARVYPVVRTGFNGQRQQQSFIGLPFANPTTGTVDTAGDGALAKTIFNNFGVSLDVDWEIDLWGRIRTSQAAAIAEWQAADAEQGGLKTSLAAQTAKVWFAIQEADQQLDLALRSLDSFRESERTISDGFELANLPASQLRLAMAETASAEALVEERRGQKKLAVRQLQILLGKYPSGSVESPGKFSSMPKPPPAGLPSDLVHRRADMIAAERRAAAADKRIREAELALLPQINLTGTGGTASETLRNSVNPDNVIWSIAGSVGQTLFAGGEIKANVSKREAIAKEAIANFQRTALIAFTEVENALTAEDLLKRREAALQRSEEYLEEAYGRSMDEYKDGVGDILTILTTQKNLLQAKSQVISIQRLRLENRIDLHLALGGGFDAREVAAAEKAKRESRRDKKE
ncbi:MAG: efflux transporter outer membrane subunit [Verrucomicrobiales bacterium]